MAPGHVIMKGLSLSSYPWLFSLPSVPRVLSFRLPVETSSNACHAIFRGGRLFDEPRSYIVGNLATHKKIKMKEILFT